MKLVVFCISIIALSLVHTSTYPQCFASPGNPIAGSANLGVLDKGILRTVSFYQYNLSDRYFFENSVAPDSLRGAVSSANYNYVGLSLGYGISPKFTLEAEAGYFINKTQNFRNTDFTERGFGFSNAVISGKYNVYRNVVNGVEFSIAAGGKIPFSTKPQIVDGVELSIDAQPSTGNFGGVFQSFFVKEFDAISARIIMINRYEKNFTENKRGYFFGDSFSNALFLSKHLANPYTHLTKDITAILQIRHEHNKPYQKDGELRDNVSGSHLLIISPQINYNLRMTWNFSLTYDVPVYQFYNGTQLAKAYAITFSLTKDFGYGL